MAVFTLLALGLAMGSGAVASKPSGYEQALGMLAQLRARAEAASGHPVNVNAAGPGGCPTSGYISPNLQCIANIPLPQTGISLAFIGNTLFVSTVVGLFSYDITDPTNPTLLGALPMYIWENEKMSVDAKRNLLFVSRDPRGFTSPATTAFPYGAIQIFDVSNPAVFRPVSIHFQPTGHTASCINDCTFLYISGPAKPALLTPAIGPLPQGADPAWPGRPTWAVDITDPTNPIDCPDFIDTKQDDGGTTYDHVTDVDAMGVAWISGSKHLRGYWTSGQHLNPLTGNVETATPCKPIPYGGGGTSEGDINSPAMTSGLIPMSASGVIHNSARNLGVAVDGRYGDVIAATEEVTVTDCAFSGRFITYDLGNTYTGAGWKSTTKNPFRMRVLDKWTPENQPGSTGCDSAHWFTDRGDGLIAAAFYTQGMRVLDINDPRHIQQVAYWNVPDTSGASTNNTWAAYWHNREYIYTADLQRGVDILHYSGRRGASIGHPPEGASSGSAGAAQGASTVGAAPALPSTLRETTIARILPAAIVGIALILLSAIGGAVAVRKIRSEG